MKSILQFVRTPTVACIGTGLLLGQMVLAMAERQQHGLAGFGFAATCVLAAGASLTLFLRHQHEQRGLPARSAPVNAWLLLFGLALLTSIGWAA